MELLLPYIGQLAWLITASIIGLFMWQYKRLSLRIEDTYKKYEVNQLIDLKLTGIQTELSTLKATDARLEAQITRLEGKIDKLLEKLS